DTRGPILAGDCGKTEAWVILHADPGSALYTGLKPGVDRPGLEIALRNGTVESALHRVEPRQGDCFFIPGGTVHAIGGGIVLAEIQQTSDATFRLYDWKRVDSNGRPRPLHLDQAMQCIDFDAGPVEAIKPACWESAAGRHE